MTNRSDNCIEIIVGTVEEVSVMLLKPVLLDGCIIVLKARAQHCWGVRSDDLTIHSASQSNQGSPGIPGEDAPHQGDAKPNRGDRQVLPNYIWKYRV